MQFRKRCLLKKKFSQAVYYILSFIFLACTCQQSPMWINNCHSYLFIRLESRCWHDIRWINSNDWRNGKYNNYPCTYCTALFYFWNCEYEVCTLHVLICTSKRLRSRKKVQHSTWITYLYWMHCYCSIVTVWSEGFLDGVASPELKICILFCHPHFRGSIQNIENNCTISLPLITLTLYYITKW